MIQIVGNVFEEFSYINYWKILFILLFFCGEGIRGCYSQGPWPRRELNPDPQRTWKLGGRALDGPGTRNRHAPIYLDFSLQLFNNITNKERYPWRSTVSSKFMVLCVSRTGPDICWYLLIFAICYVRVCMCVFFNFQLSETGDYNYWRSQTEMQEVKEIQWQHVIVPLRSLARDSNQGPRTSHCGDLPPVPSRRCVLLVPILRQFLPGPHNLHAYPFASALLFPFPVLAVLPGVPDLFVPALYSVLWFLWPLPM